MSLIEKKCIKLTLRKSEQDGVYFRSNRFYKINRKYYCSTREGVEIGPYDSKDEADIDLIRFIRRVEKNELKSPPKRLFYKAILLSQTMNKTY